MILRKKLKESADIGKFMVLFQPFLVAPSLEVFSSRLDGALSDLV